MRLWSLHPRYLDSKGLLAAWREGLLALKVLEGKTAGYKHHPQLLRFKESEDPIKAIAAYLSCLLDESLSRGYRFDEKKVPRFDGMLESRIKVAKGQVEYEMRLLSGKLQVRDPVAYAGTKDVSDIEVNGIFEIVEGGISEWEKVKESI